MMLGIFSSVCLPWRSVCFSFVLFFVFFVVFFAHFLIGLFVFLALSCMDCLYILEINPLSVFSFAIIFSHPEGCLFTLLIVSFAVQSFKFNQVLLVYF